MSRKNENNRPVIQPDEDTLLFADRVDELSGVNTRLCWHCLCCSGGCPFTGAMDYLPNQVIRLVQMGLKEEALACSTIWVCVGCNTCSMACPMAIDMAAIMDVLRHMAMDEGVAVAEPDILNFHKEVLNSIHRYGRTHKLEIMLRYKFVSRQFLTDIDVGLRMLSKRKLDLRPSKVRDMAAIKRLFKRAKKERP